MCVLVSSRTPKHLGQCLDTREQDLDLHIHGLVESPAARPFEREAFEQLGKFLGRQRVLRHME